MLLLLLLLPLHNYRLERWCQRNLLWERLSVWLLLLAKLFPWQLNILEDYCLRLVQIECIYSMFLSKIIIENKATISKIKCILFKFKTRVKTYMVCVQRSYKAARRYTKLISACSRHNTHFSLSHSNSAVFNVNALLVKTMQMEDLVMSWSVKNRQTLLACTKGWFTFNA